MVVLLFSEPCIWIVYKSNKLRAKGMKKILELQFNLQSNDIRHFALKNSRIYVVKHLVKTFVKHLPTWTSRAATACAER